jgi:hypothetical protein
LPMDDRDIIFEEVRPGSRKMKWNFPEAEQTRPKYPDYIPGTYDSLSEELRVKCNPNRFMSPYDYEKVKISNAIFSAVDQCGEDIKQLRALRRQAIDLLGIRFATETLYLELTSQLEPSQFFGDSELTDQANELYQQTLLNADNIEELERIQTAIPKRLANAILAKKEEKEEELKRQRELKQQREQQSLAKEEYKGIIIIITTIAMIFIGILLIIITQ